MSEVSFRSDMVVTHIQHMGADWLFAEAARQSTQASSKATPERDTGLIRSLMKKRHTSPFEHSALTVAVECPLFVSREWERHRTQSYSELSLRYTEATPEFWLPSPEHGIENIGTKMKPKRGWRDYAEDDDFLLEAEAEQAIKVSYQLAWRYYQEQLSMGVAEEVARTVLPLGTYTRFWATANAINWLRFISLRTHDEKAVVVSYPQIEIEQAARQVEGIFAEIWPVTYASWLESGRAL